MGLLEILGIRGGPEAIDQPGNDPSRATRAGDRPPPSVPPAKPAPENTPLQALHDEALNYDREVRRMEEVEYPSLENQRRQLNDLEASRRMQRNQGRLSDSLWLHYQEEYKIDDARLRAKEQDLRRRLQSAVDREAGLRARIQEARNAPPYRSVDPEDAIDAAAYRAGALAATKLAVSATALVASAYAIAKDIQYILDADTAIEGLRRTGDVAVENAVGAAQLALVKHITKSSPVALVLGTVAGMCGDQANSCDLQEEVKRKKAAEKAAREYKRQEMLAVGKFLDQTSPGTVEWVEDTYHIRNQKVWNATVKRVRQMRSEYFERQKLDLVLRAQTLGRKDGKTAEEFTHVNQIKSWKEVKASPSPDMLFLELFQEYKVGFTEGNAKRKALFERARKLGYKDGKANTKNSDRMTQWPEFAELLREGTNPATLLQQLQESYQEGRAAISTAVAP